jgi:6-phosphogluconolactonase (cycloisomerase 2 family)
VHPSGKFAYAVNFGTYNITAYSVNQSNGTLSEIETVPTGQSPFAHAIDNAGKFLYVGNYYYYPDGYCDLYMYAIDPMTGKLALLGGIATPNRPSGVTVHPNSQFVYVTNDQTNQVTTYKVVTGSKTELQKIGSTPSGAKPYGLAVEALGKYAYAANFDSNDVSAYSINQTTGALTPMGTAIPAGSNPRAIAADPSGRFLYVANKSSNSISIYSISLVDGSLSALGTTVTGPAPRSLVVTGVFDRPQ